MIKMIPLPVELLLGTPNPSSALEKLPGEELNHPTPPPGAQGAGPGHTGDGSAGIQGRIPAGSHPSDLTGWDPSLPQPGWESPSLPDPNCSGWAEGLGCSWRRDGIHPWVGRGAGINPWVSRGLGMFPGRGMGSIPEWAGGWECPTPVIHPRVGRGAGMPHPWVGGGSRMFHLWNPSQGNSDPMSFPSSWREITAWVRDSGTQRIPRVFPQFPSSYSKCFLHLFPLLIPASTPFLALGSGCPGGLLHFLRDPGSFSKGLVEQPVPNSSFSLLPFSLGSSSPALPARGDHGQSQLGLGGLEWAQLENSHFIPQTTQFGALPLGKRPHGPALLLFPGDSAARGWSPEPEGVRDWEFGIPEWQRQVFFLFPFGLGSAIQSSDSMSCDPGMGGLSSSPQTHPHAWSNPTKAIQECPRGRAPCARASQGSQGMGSRGGTALEGLE